MHAGGGSGGSLWAECKNFIGRGQLKALGGNGNNNGGGGAGGRIAVYYDSGGFHSNQIDAHGGLRQSSSAEHGGPGVIFLRGLTPAIRNLRIDNKGRKAEVFLLKIQCT